MLKNVKISYNFLNLETETVPPEDVDMEGMTPDAIKEMILGGSSVKKEPTVEVTITSQVTTTTTVTTSQTIVDGVVKVSFLKIT